MKSTMTLTDEVDVPAAGGLHVVSDALADLITKAGDFAFTGQVEHLKVELKTDSTTTYTRTYAQLVLKVSSQD